MSCCRQANLALGCCIGWCDVGWRWIVVIAASYGQNAHDQHHYYCKLLYHDYASTTIIKHVDVSQVFSEATLAANH